MHSLQVLRLHFGSKTGSKQMPSQNLLGYYKMDRRSANGRFGSSPEVG